MHLLYPTWQIKGLLFLLCSAEIQFISLHQSGNAPAENDACMLYIHSFFGLSGLIDKAHQVLFLFRFLIFPEGKTKCILKQMSILQHWLRLTKAAGQFVIL